MASVAPAIPWKQLLMCAIDSNSHLKHSSYFHLATVSPNGRPSNRTVVFRGFQEASHKIEIHTDTRTQKIQDLKHCPFAEVCWYFTETWEQFRIKGRMEVVDCGHLDPHKLSLREKAWFSCSLRSRSQYFGPEPGLPCLSSEPHVDLSVDPLAGPMHTFCLLILNPDQVDYLNLKRNERRTFTVKQSDHGMQQWVQEDINP